MLYYDSVCNRFVDFSPLRSVVWFQHKIYTKIIIIVKLYITRVTASGLSSPHTVCCRFYKKQNKKQVHRANNICRS